MLNEGIAPGDMVRVSSGGRVYHALVRGAVVGGFEIEPIERGIPQRRIKPREVVEHWSRSRAPGPASRSAREQRSFDDLLDR